MASVAVDVDDRSPGGLGAGIAARLLVNKQELARRVLKCSLPTLNDLIERYPDFPIVTRGSNGVEWQFDAAAVVDFLGERRAAEQQESAARADLFRQFTLPIDDIAPEEAREMSPAGRAQLARARLAERKLALESGFLLQATETRQVMTVMLTRLGKSLDALPAQLGRRFNLPDEVVRVMREQIEDYRRNAVGELREFLSRDSAA